MIDEYIRKAKAIEEVNRALDRETVLLSFVRKVTISALKRLPSADVVQVVRCKDCIHNNDCDIQYSAQAGDNFFCGFGETEKDIREDVI